MGVVSQHGRLLAVVVQVAAVRTVQPHVSRRTVAVIVNRPLAHADARSLVAAVLFHDMKLRHHAARDEQVSKCVA